VGDPHPFGRAAGCEAGPAGQSRDSLICNGCVIDGTVVNSVLSPGVRVERGALVSNSVIMNDTVIRSGALVDKCVLDKEIEVGAGAQVGIGDDMTPNQLEPANIDTGITIVGKRATYSRGRQSSGGIAVSTRTQPPADYDKLEVPAAGRSASERKLSRPSSEQGHSKSGVLLEVAVVTETFVVATSIVHALNPY